MSNTVLVTGATGKTGRRLVPLLAGRGVTVRAATRDPDTMIQDAQTVRFDWRDPRTYAPALDGVDAVYLVSSHHSDDTVDPSDQVAAFVQAAAEAGVRRIVQLSAFGVDQAPGDMPLRRTERVVETSGLEYTILRPSAFMENFSEKHWARFVDNIRDRSELPMPGGSVRMSFVSVRDIAAVAAIALTEDGHAGRGYTLTGPQALSWAEVAGHATAAAGRPVRYVETDADWIRRHLLDGGASPEFADHVAELTTSSVGGDFMAAVTGHVQAVTGRAPIAFAGYARTAAPAWRRHASLAPERTAP
jgi:uncharacterized protein YbjT (DUF2867 family)